MSMPVAASGFPKNITGTGNIGGGSLTGCQMLGFYVNNTSSGTLVLRDGGSGGTQVSGTITPAIGYHPFPGQFGGIAHATIANTLDVTFFFATGS